jgi:polyferredoxin
MISNDKECQVRMDMSHSQPDPPKNRIKRVLKWVLTCLPLGGIAWASFLPLQTWMQQALILVALIWFYVFFLLDTFFLGG